MVINNICKNCGGELKFDVNSEELRCDKCSTIIDIPEENKILIRKKLNDNSTIKSSKTKYAQFHCASCGRNHIMTINSELNSCPCCGDSNLSRTINVEYMPDGIIPFKLDKEKAINCFKEWLKKRKFAPRDLKKKVINYDLNGEYIPAYIYSLYCNSTYSGYGVIQYTTRSYSSSGSNSSTPITHYHREFFSGSREDEYINLIDSANKNIPTDTLRKISNYDYQNVYVYRPEFLYGWIGSEVNIYLKESFERTKDFVLFDIKSKAQYQPKYNYVENFTCSTDFLKKEYNYLYLPVWSCSYKYKNKIYNFYINGATGKIHGKAPKSKGKIAALTLLVLAGIGLIAYFVIKYFLK